MPFFLFMITYNRNGNTCNILIDTTVDTLRYHYKNQRHYCYNINIMLIVAVRFAMIISIIIPKTILKICWSYSDYLAAINILSSLFILWLPYQFSDHTHEGLPSVNGITVSPILNTKQSSVVRNWKSKQQGQRGKSALYQEK